MTAIFLAWDPEQRTGWTYPTAVEQVAETGLHLSTWMVEAASAVPADADVWLLLCGRHGRGLLGHGMVVSDRVDMSPGGVPAAPLTIRVAFDALLPLGDHLPAAVLEAAVPDIAWDATFPDTDFGAGNRGYVQAVAPPDEPGLRQLWSESGPRPGPDPTRPVPGTMPREAVARVEANRYENDPDARRACIAHHGTSCAACGFSFEVAFGAVGKDFIPVHHLVPASRLGSSYELDPVTDLVPLCANCHAMAHEGVSTARTVAELRRIIAGAGFLGGSRVTSQQLEAQRQARALLGPQ